MYCTWTKQALAAALLLASVHAPAPALATVVMPDEAGVVAKDSLGLLEVASSGYSRFEIADDAVVAFFTGGVEARYAGHTLRCAHLRINQLTKRAELTGGVALLGPQASLTCVELSLDLASGEAALTGGLNGSFNLNRDLAVTPELLQFAAGSARFSLPAPESDLTAGNLRAALEGNVLLTAPDGSRLSAPRADYDGVAGTLVLPDKVVGIIVMPEGGSLGQPGSTPAAGPGELYLRADGLRANFDERGEFSGAVLDAPRLTMLGARLSAASAQLRPLPASGQAKDEEDSYALVLSGEPVQVALLVNGQAVALAAHSLTISRPGGATQVLQLQGQVRLRGGGLDGVTEAATLTAGQAGNFSLAFPRGIRIGADIAGLTGMETVQLEELTAPR